MNKELFHYGTPHMGVVPHSGRYPWDPTKHDGSYKSNMSFLEEVAVYKSKGLTDTQISKMYGITLNDYRKIKSVALAEQNAAFVRRAQRLKDHGYSNTEIGRLMGRNESTIRGWLEPRETTRKERYNNLVDILETKVKNGEIVDVGLGSELELGVTKTTFDTAIKILKDKGYVVDTVEVKQPNDPNKATTVKYLAPEGTTKKYVYDHRGEIVTVTEHSTDGGKTYTSAQPPTSVSLDRVYIEYSDENGKGGAERDGMIGIRRNVDDITLGTSSYAQVRIAVNEKGTDKYYIKGMAIYDDNVPEGYDICVYSNKKESDGVAKALKPLKDDPTNPFGATLTAKGQSYYKDEKGKYIQTDDGNFVLAKANQSGDRYSLSPVNKLKSEGEWGKGSTVLPSQFLSKQPMPVINKQLDLTYKDNYAEYDEIMSITNPIVKRKLLNDFAEGCDKKAVVLKASALPRQSTKVIIPVPELGDNEIYAPTYKNGEHVVLIRYPHAGTFEIPYLKVNNNNKEGKALLKNAADAVGINGAVASKLSGADYDGDFVTVIPVNDKVKIKWDESLKGLKNFNPSDAYAGYPGMKVMTDQQRGIQMGVVSNLITDMTLQNAEPDEMVRAVKHSMVVIDATKHELNWKLSEKENRIDELKQKYQKNPDKNKGYGGTTTLISRAKSELVVPEREKVNSEGKKTYTPDPKTGEWLYKDTGRTYNQYKKNSKGQLVLDDNGKPITITKTATEKTTQMAYAKDARDLISTYNTPQEKAYANYANKMKALANKARKEALAQKTPKSDPEASKTYAEQVNSLKAKLNIAKKNKPLERQAQLKTSVKIDTLKETTPSLFEKENKDKLRKEKAKILDETRREVGAGKQSIVITEKEWEAIQAHAISGTMLDDILKNSDMEYVRKLATPKNPRGLSAAKKARIKALSNSGNTIADIAEIMGVSTSTVSDILSE